MIYYGRHGSCYLSKPSDYDAPYKVLACADSVGKLTPLGRDVLSRLTQIRNDAYNHWGELTDVGVSQVREIALRMAERFPEIFCKDAYHIGARSLRNTRSMLSMEYTMNQIAKLTRIRVYRNASQEFSYYLDHQDVTLQPCRPMMPSPASIVMEVGLHSRFSTIQTMCVLMWMP